MYRLALDFGSFSNNDDYGNNFCLTPSLPSYVSYFVSGNKRKENKQLRAVVSGRTKS
jgi:hypothetical protein